MKSYNTDPMMRDVQPRSNVRVVCYNKLAVVIFREELIHLASYFQLFVDVSDRITINPNLQEISEKNDGNHAGFFFCRAPFGVHG